MVKSLKFTAVHANQHNQRKVFTFAASASQVFKMAQIDRAGRTEEGELFGFQRPQVARHIHEIRDYLRTEDAVLPNSVVIAFVGDVRVKEINDKISELTIKLGNEPPGYVVDGQQRLTALRGINDPEIEIFVSAILCEDEEDLRRQFILINNTKPLPKELIYELLPTVSGLPHRMSNRTFAAELTARLNFKPATDTKNRPALKNEIRQHTNPLGTISSNAIQKVIMNSRSNGALREFSREEDCMDKSYNLIADFYGAVLDLFNEAWIGYGPRTSRLKHSVGIISLGYAMEIAYFEHDARIRSEFKESLQCLAEDNICAWTHGMWIFKRNELRKWHQLQNTQPDIRLLSDYLVRVVKDQGIRKGSDLEKVREQYFSQENLID